MFGREAEGIPWSQVETELCLRVFVGCIVGGPIHRIFLGSPILIGVVCAETLAFHGGVTLGCYVILGCLDWYNVRKKTPTPPSGIRQQFRWVFTQWFLSHSDGHPLGFLTSH